MGCGTSKFDNEEVVRCKNRKLLMQQTVSSRHAFAAAHAKYVHALKNVAAAFRGFAETHEFESPTQEPVQLKPPPPPMLYPSSSSLPSPGFETIQRAVSMPVFTLQKQPSSPPKTPPNTYIYNNPKDTEEEENRTEFGRMQGPPSPPLSSSPLPASSTPPATVTTTWDYLNVFHVDPALNMQESRKMHQVLETVGEQQEPIYGKEAEWEGSESVESDERDQKQQVQERLREKQLNPEVLDQAINKPVKTSMPEEAQNWSMITQSSNDRKDLADALRDVDESFLAAYQSGKEVSVMLEARKTHYHSNFVDSKGYFDHSRKVLNAISWGYFDENNKVPLASQEGKDDVEEHQTHEHASTLDQLLAWEKKLYEEVKGAESVQLQYDRKRIALQHQENKVDEPEGLEKLKATVKALRTRITVAVEAINTASSAINRLRDEELYPQLLELVSGLRQMWEKMYSCHQKQDFVVNKQLNRLDNLKNTRKTSSLQMLATKELVSTLYTWHDTLTKSIESQKSFVQDLNKWIYLSLEPLDILSKYGSDTLMKREPPISSLCLAWEKALEALRVEVAAENIKQLAQTVSDIVEEHAQEANYQKDAERHLKELKRKEEALRNYERRFMDTFALPVEEKTDGTAGPIERDPLRHKKVELETLQGQLDEDNKRIEESLKKSRQMITNQFPWRLKATFQPLATFASLCSVAYQGLSRQENMAQYSRLSQL